jgi:hypothetical protein
MAEQRIANLNGGQRSAFDKIVEAVETKSGKAFFLHGPGGTGKTHVYNTLCYFLRGQLKIVLCVASSGIAALLIQGGRTVHSMFKVPLQINDESTCHIPKNSEMGELIRNADVVIWDEAPMQHHHIAEAVDRTFKDVRNSEQPFGGLSIIFGGDFAQILPVIVKGSRAQIVGACLRRSYLWAYVEVLHLTENMRLNGADREEADFAQWQLEVGHGRHTDDEGTIRLPDHFKCGSNTIESLSQTIYPDINVQQEDAYFAERTILSSRNDDVDRLNQSILEHFPGEEMEFTSSDSVEETEGMLYPTEYLNSVTCSGMPLSKLKLKIGSPVIILRNLNPQEGVCNGTRAILTRITNRVLEVRQITGDHVGSLVFIPRMKLQPSDAQLPFKLTRCQFPVKLCFSMTINKAQGQSVTHVGLDLRSAVFTHGQLYVAISRVRSVHNIKAVWDAQFEQPTTKNLVFPEVLLTPP